MTTLVKLVAGFLFIGGLVIGLYIGHYVWDQPVVIAMNQTPANVEAPKPLQLPVPSVQQVKAQVPACEDRSYTVKAGDNLSVIARNNYGGRSYFYPYLAEVNKLENPNLIHPGQILQIPCKVELCCLPALETRVAVKKATAKTVVAKKTEKVPAKQMETPAPAPQAQVAPPAAQPAAQPQAPAAPVVPQAQPQPAPPAPAPPVNVEQKVVNQNNVSLVLPPAAQIAAPTPEIRKSEVQSWQRSRVEPENVTTLPGSLWDTFVVTPLEPGNRANYFHVDQGIILGELPGGVKFKPYYAFNTVKDTKGFAWNNRMKHEAGIKLDKPFSHGIVSVGGAYASETRYGKEQPRETKSGLMLFNEGWVGWDQSTPSSRTSMFSSAPGSGWWVVGNVSPFEKNNIIFSSFAEQGVTLVKAKRLSIIPEVWGQLGADTKGNPWNNRYHYGAGVKVPVSWSSGVVSATVGYECAKEYRVSSNSSCGPKLRADLWNGWLGKLGGK